MATNALLEHKVEGMALMITKFTAHRQPIKSQYLSPGRSCDMEDLNDKRTAFSRALCHSVANFMSSLPQKIEMPEMLYESVVEVEERIVLFQGTCQLKLEAPVVTGTTGEKVCVCVCV